MDTEEGAEDTVATEAEAVDMEVDMEVDTEATEVDTEAAEADTVTAGEGMEATEWAAWAAWAAWEDTVVDTVAATEAEEVTASDTRT